MQDVFQSEASLVQAPLPLFNYELGIRPEATASQRQKWNFSEKTVYSLSEASKILCEDEVERLLFEADKFVSAGGSSTRLRSNLLIQQLIMLTLLMQVMRKQKKF